MIGYGLHHYPQTWDSFAWGAAIGLAAVAATSLAPFAGSLSTRAWARIVAAFAAYGGVLFAPFFVLPSEGNAFVLSIMVRILKVNAVAYGGLVVLHRLAINLGLLPAPSGGRPAAA